MAELFALDHMGSQEEMQSVADTLQVVERLVLGIRLLRKLRFCDP